MFRIKEKKKWHFEQFLQTHLFSIGLNFEILLQYGEHNGYLMVKVLLSFFVLNGSVPRWYTFKVQMILFLKE